ALEDPPIATGRPVLPVLRDDITAPAAVDPVASPIRSRDGILAAPQGGHVGPFPGLNLVLARPPDDRVRTAAAEDHVEACTALEQVVARRSLDEGELRIDARDAV